MKIDDANACVFTYDNLYQLTFVDYNDSNSTSYSYDSLGNRTDVNDGTPTTYLRNNLNQYTSVGGTNYSYDNNGNLIDDGLFKYYYDCENRLTDVNDQSDTAVASYSYDYLGRRISKTVYGSPDVTTKYCYDGDQVIAEYDGSDNLLRKFVYGPGIDEPICMIDVTDSNAVYYYHFDGLGGVAALSDASANIVESYSYDVFGAPTIYDANETEISQSTIGNPYMFTARRADDETALYYYRARYYAFDVGRFLQTDPIGYFDGLNLYAYCGNNPLNYRDPLGLCKSKDKASRWDRTWEGWKENWDIFKEWFWGNAPTHYTYGPDSGRTQDLMNHVGVNLARDKHNANPESITEYDYEFWLRGFLESGLNTTAQYVGHYTVLIIPNEDGTTQTVIVNNETNMKSFLYHLTPESWNPPTGKIMGQNWQTYTWTEPLGTPGYSRPEFDYKLWESLGP